MDDAMAFLREDPALGPLVEAAGPVSIGPAADPFERLLASIIRQQVSMDAAAAIEGRLHEQVEPTPDAILDAEPAVMRDAGLSASKVEYSKALSAAWVENGWDTDYFASHSDDEVVDELTEVRGIGVWTAKMFLIFGLGRADVFPVEDLGIRNAMEQVFDEELTRSEMVDIAERWSPYRSHASQYLWSAID